MYINTAVSTQAVAEQIIEAWNEARYVGYDSEIDFYYEVLQENGMTLLEAAEVIMEIDID